MAMDVIKEIYATLQIDDFNRMSAFRAFMAEKRNLIRALRGLRRRYALVHIEVYRCFKAVDSGAGAKLSNIFVFAIL